MSYRVNQNLRVTYRILISAVSPPCYWGSNVVTGEAGMSGVKYRDDTGAEIMTPEQIVITPLMIEAGSSAISGYWSTESPGFDPEQLAMLVFQAMTIARETSTIPTVSW